MSRSAKPASGSGRGSEGADRVQVEWRAAVRTPCKEVLLRFGFGAGVSLLAAVASTLFGPFVGGVFLAFPAILLASLTLVAEEEGIRRARDDARGAVLGTLGLWAFAGVTAVLVRHHSAWLALGAATAAWAGVSLGAYALTWAVGLGRDERSRADR